MSHINQNVFKLAELKEACKYVAQMLSATDCQAFLPIFQRLEKEMEALSANESAMDRARRMVKKMEGHTQL
jgi:hypothetical protein